MNDPSRTRSGQATRETSRDRRWLVVSVPAPPRGEELLLIDALRRLGARAVQRDGERFVAHLPEPRRRDALLVAVERAVRASTSLRDVALGWEWQVDEAWAARRARDVPCGRVADRIVVTPVGWRLEPGEEGDVVIRLVPGVAFGTAGHATTRGCLRLLERLVEHGQRVADVGAGSGILAIAAALLGAGHVLALERDPLACAAARENVAANGIAGRVELRQVRVGPDALRRLDRLDGIVANIETDVILRLLPGFRDALAPGGWLVLSGVPGEEPRAVKRAAATLGLELRDELDVDGWWVGAFGRV